MKTNLKRFNGQYIVTVDGVNNTFGTLHYALVFIFALRGRVA